MKLNAGRHAVDIGGVCVLAAITAAVYLGGVAPVLSRAQARVLQQDELRQREQEASQKSQDLRDAHTRLAALEREQGRAVRLSPLGVRNERLRRISELGAAAGISITELTPREPVKGDRVSRVPISIAGTGSGAAFGAFLAHLHQEFSDTQVVCFSIASELESREQPASVSAELVWFALGEATRGGGVEGTASRTGGAGNAGTPAPSGPN